MRLDFSKSWIFRGWIRHFMVTLFAQAVFSRTICNEYQHLKDGRCCSSCKPGMYAFTPCTRNSDTKCRPCGSKEYQPDWNHEPKCLTQKFCDKGKGFWESNEENRTAPVPCRCKPGLQCSLINCEYCEAMQECGPGMGLTVDKSGMGSCAPCQHGHFSNVSSTEPCKAWTDCKALGKIEKQPGNEKADSVCGPHIAGTSTLWFVVAVLSAVIVISLVVLLLFFYKDRLKPLSENLRTCLQNLKRKKRIQQETLQPPYSYYGPLNLACYEVTHLIPNPKNSPGGCPSDGLAPANALLDLVDQTGSGLPGGEEAGSWPSCSCVMSMEPMEVGENEDCSQAVATGVGGACSCGHEKGWCSPTPLLEQLLYKNCCPESAASHQGGPRSCQDLANNAAWEDNGVGTRGEGDQRQNEPCCCSIDSTTPPSLYLASDDDRGHSLRDVGELGLSEGDASADPGSQCSSHGLDTPLASGNVSGKNNTTFISSGQVMNFSGDVIVVYVSQSVKSGDEVTGEAFGRPVQEESFPGKPGADNVQREDVSTPMQERPAASCARQPEDDQRSLPVQEESHERLHQKIM